MSDILRQTSEQYANRIAALQNQITAAQDNITSWEKELSDISAAKEHVDSKLGPEERAQIPVATGRAPATRAEVLAAHAATEKPKR
jgi:predicted  nucleic acid-binding Zn-ribbon protein